MKINLKKDVILAPYTTYGIGGKADYFCVVKDRQSFLDSLDWAYKEGLTFFVIGGGSNVLIADSGVRGLVIINRANNYKITNDEVVAESGASLSKIAKETISLGLTGLDFAANIPGTIGGAVVGNAGAYGRSVSNSLISGEVWQAGEVKNLNNQDFDFSYRYSNVKNNPEKVLISARFSLCPGDKNEMEKALNEDKQKRAVYSGKNCGSYFCNVNTSSLSENQLNKLSNYIVHDKVVLGKLFDDLGYKGKEVGDARISEKHANVILNTGNATAKDIIELEKEIMRSVFEEYGMVLIPEVTKIGEF